MTVMVAKPAASGVWTRRQIMFLALLMLVMVANYVDRAILSILQEPIKADLKLSDLQLGLISGPAFALLYSVVGLPMARLADRANRVTVLSAAVAFWSAMTACCGLAGSFAQLALARVGVGVGEGACTPTAHSLLSDYFSPRQRGLALAFLTTSIPLAGTLAPLLGGFVAPVYGWRVTFMVAGLPGILIAVLFFMLAKEPRFPNGERFKMISKEGRKTFLQDVKWLVGNRAYMLVFVGTVFTGMAIGGTNVFTASYLLREFGLSLKTAGIIMAISMGGAGLLGTFIGGWSADRFAGTTGRSYAMVPAIGSTLACFLFLGAYSAATWVAAAVLLVIANVMTDLKNGPNFAIVQNLVPDHMRATGSAFLMMGATLLGTSSGPLIVGLVSDMAAASYFPDAMGAYRAVCEGGTKGGIDALAQACSSASAYGIKTALMTISFAYLATGIAFFFASRHVNMKLD